MEDGFYRLEIMLPYSAPNLTLQNDVGDLSFIFNRILTYSRYLTQNAAI